MKKTVILYHKNCNDGFGSAWAAWKKFGEKAEYIPIFHDDPYPAGLKGKDVYMLDISFDTVKTKKLLGIAKTLTIIDHHISAETSTKMATDYLYELNNSGTVLAWKYFHPGKKLPLLAKYLEDIDIWKMAITGSPAIISSLETYEMDFKVWDKIARDLENAKLRRKYLDAGNAILLYKERLIKSALRDAEEVRFLGNKALVINYGLSLNSEIGDAMRKKGYSLGIIWQMRRDKLIVSMRSTDKVDVSKIAVRFGGGGHKKAAAFRLHSKEKFPWKRTKK